MDRNSSFTEMDVEMKNACFKATVRERCQEHNGARDGLSGAIRHRLVLNGTHGTAQKAHTHCATHSAARLLLLKIEFAQFVMKFVGHVGCLFEETVSHSVNCRSRCRQPHITP